MKQENKENKNKTFSMRSAHLIRHLSMYHSSCVCNIRKTTGHVKRARAHEFYLHHCHYSCIESNVYAYPNSFSLKR